MKCGADDNDDSKVDGSIADEGVAKSDEDEDEEEDEDGVLECGDDSGRSLSEMIVEVNTGKCDDEDVDDDSSDDNCR